MLAVVGFGGEGGCDCEPSEWVWHFGGVMMVMVMVVGLWVEDVGRYLLCVYETKCYVADC